MRTFISDSSRSSGVLRGRENEAAHVRRAGLKSRTPLPGPGRRASGFAASSRSEAGGVPRATAGFTLLEVALAMALFFAITFVLLQITATNLKIARALQHTTVDASSLAAELSLTNQLEEGTESGDFGDLHPGFEWRRDTTLVGTNGLFEVRFEVFRSGQRDPESVLNVLLYRPDSATRAGGGSERGIVR